MAEDNKIEAPRVPPITTLRYRTTGEVVGTHQVQRVNTGPMQEKIIKTQTSGEVKGRR